MKELAEIFGLTIKEQVKSDFQKRMEADGWRFLQNESMDNHAGMQRKLGTWTDDELRGMGAQVEPITESSLRRKYIKRGHAEVVIGPGYNWQGVQMPNARGVYVRDK